MNALATTHVPITPLPSHTHTHTHTHMRAYTRTLLLRSSCRLSERFGLDATAGQLEELFKEFGRGGLD